MTVPPAPTPPPWPPVAPPRPSRRPMFTFLVIALAAIGIAIGSWFRPLPSTKASAPPAHMYIDQQVGTAEANVCAAFEKIEHAVNLSDNERASSSDRTEQLVAAALARQVLDFGSRYSLAMLAEEPAAPPHLGAAVRQQANAFQSLFIGYIDGVSIPTQTCNRP
jgi:hypothetical protein